MLLKERNRGDGEACPGRVFNYEIAPVSQPNQPITEERSAETIGLIEGGRSLLDQLEVVVSVPPLSHGPPPNGSRLSCGASAGGRKHPALRYELVGGQTYASSESRPRQLQALVRRQLDRKSVG